MVRHAIARGTWTWAAAAVLWTALLLPSVALAQKDTPTPKPSAEAAARHLVVVGQKPIRIHVPSGFVEPSLKVPGFAVIGEQFTPPTDMAWVRRQATEWVDALGKR